MVDEVFCGCLPRPCQPSQHLFPSIAPWTHGHTCACASTDSVGRRRDRVCVLAPFGIDALMPVPEFACMRVVRSEQAVISILPHSPPTNFSPGGPAPVDLSPFPLSPHFASLRYLLFQTTFPRNPGKLISSKHSIPPTLLNLAGTGRRKFPGVSRMARLSRH